MKACQGWEGEVWGVRVRRYDKKKSLPFHIKIHKRYIKGKEDKGKQQAIVKRKDV